MTDGTRGPDDRNEPPDDEAALSARLQRLGRRLAKANRPSENGSGPRQTADPSAIARGFRLSTQSTNSRSASSFRSSASAIPRSPSPIRRPIWSRPSSSSRYSFLAVPPDEAWYRAACNQQQN